MKRKLLQSILLCVLAVGGAMSFQTAQPTYAQFVPAESGIGIPGQNLDDEGGLEIQPIYLPVLVDIQYVKNFSIISYLTFGLNLVVFVLIAYWVYLALRAGYKIINSYGESEKIEDARNTFVNLWWAITFLTAGFAFTVIVGAVFGVGDFTQWPRAFSICEDGTFYFTYAANHTDIEGYDESWCLDGGEPEYNPLP